MTSTRPANPAPALALALALAALLAPALPAQAPAAIDAPRYPASTALAEGISPEALARLDALVQGFVDDGEVVGAELLVVKDGRSILHTAHGWRDRERELAMRPGSVFCVRSMTKPLIGAAVRMLIEDGELKSGDHVAALLPSFDVEGQRDITIGQLLEHTSGLPMSMIMAQDPRALESVRAVADLGGACELEFEPGTGFRYSDQGTDTLTAVIEVVTDAPAEEFVRARRQQRLMVRYVGGLTAAFRGKIVLTKAGEDGPFLPIDLAVFPEQHP
jgi:CubicO group peptidase (beta-lactamase class C family)